IAVIPTTHGEQVVLRILHRAVAEPDLGQLGMTSAAREPFERAIRQPYGAVVVCGPTGSGKTTTLYTALHMLNDPGRVLMTIEDPVEYQIKGISQIEISPKSGLTFASGLRALREQRLSRARRALRGDARGQRDPGPDRVVDRRDLRRGGAKRHDHPARRRRSPVPRGRLLPGRDAPGHGRQAYLDDRRHD